MPSPFPGMDPYLEGYLWPDVHHDLASKIREQLAPQVRPNYVARIEVYVVTDQDPLAEVGIMYPDVEVIRSKRIHSSLSPPPTKEATATVAPPAPFELPLLNPISVRMAAVEIRDVGQDELVTSIEILSPVNKRGQGLNQYREKRQRLIEAKVHLLEIDLIRRGQRPLPQETIPTSAYRLTLTRAQAKKVEIWPIALTEPLPLLPVPLRAPDADVVLDLGQAMRDIYDVAAYELTIDYTVPPPPPALSEADANQLKAHLKAAGL